MKIDRLVSIIMILLERKIISATKLAEIFEVTTRTIYRDIETINLAGIPIVALPGIYGGISIMEGYKIDKTLFTSSDFISLLLGLRSITSTLTSKEIVGTLEKLKSRIPPEQLKNIESKSNQIAIDLTTWAGNKNTQPNMNNIRNAMQESKFLSFQYSNSNGKENKRKVEPYQLALKEKNWYLQAYCTSKQDFRIFKLSRISKLKVLDSTFIPREFIAKPLDGSDWIEKRIITIKLLMDESLRERIIDRCGEKNIKPYRNNKLLVNFPFTEDDFGYNILLGFGDKCEILEPENVRKEMTRRINKLLDNYNNPKIRPTFT